MLYGGADQDVILGDNGKVVPSGGVIQYLQVIDPTIGGGDTIFGGVGNDIIIGGTAGDEIHGGAGHDVLFGDHAEVDYTRPVDRNVISRFITAADGGGVDTIVGDAGDDFIFGGQAGDFIFGGTGPRRYRRRTQCAAG